MKLKLGLSPCPNDTFMFDALLHNRIDTQGIEFNFELEDVETLNLEAQKDTFDITKISYHGYLHVISHYQLLDSGSALGRGCGPLLIAREKIDRKKLGSCTVAIPGQFTTANLLCSLAYPEISHKIEMVFSDIETAILNGEVDAGVIIHENRFTYKEKGLEKIQDLGAYWEENTGYPIPLGGIAIKRALSQEVKQTVQDLIFQSIQYAFAHPEASRDFVDCHAQEMDDAVKKQHIALYVNDFSLTLGNEGKSAIALLIAQSQEKNLIPALPPKLAYFI